MEKLATIGAAAGVKGEGQGHRKVQGSFFFFFHFFPTVPFSLLPGFFPFVFSFSSPY
jgi:hypothetical protein